MTSLRYADGRNGLLRAPEQCPNDLPTRLVAVLSLTVSELGAEHPNWSLVHDCFIGLGMLAQECALEAVPGPVDHPAYLVSAEIRALAKDPPEQWYGRLRAALSIAAGWHALRSDWTEARSH